MLAQRAPAVMHCNRKGAPHVGAAFTYHRRSDDAGERNEPRFGLCLPTLGSTHHMCHSSAHQASHVANPAQHLSEEAASDAYETLPTTFGNRARARTSCLELSNTLPSQERQAHALQVLADVRKRLQGRQPFFLGYPINLDYDYSMLSDFLGFSINNFGDPATEMPYDLNSREFEVAVLDWFARLWEIDLDEYHGYVTTGSMEAIMYGLYIGRETLPDAVLYASQASHFSVFKAAHLLRMQAVKVSSLSTGEIDCEDLRTRLMANRSKPAIINLNIGTFMQGAIDDVDKVLQVLAECGYTRDRFYIHCDAALSGTMLPFLTGAPTISFTRPISSVSVSGHKFLGCPLPCGVVITRATLVKPPATADGGYSGARDATITCSRSGHTSLFLWYALMQEGHEGLRADAERCVRNAQLLEGMLCSAGVPASLNQFSIMVVFERPREEALVRKWQLVCEGDIAHVVVMPHVTPDMLREFVSDLLASRARMAACEPVSATSTAT